MAGLSGARLSGEAAKCKRFSVSHANRLKALPYLSFSKGYRDSFFTFFGFPQTFKTLSIITEFNGAETNCETVYPADGQLRL